MVIWQCALSLFSAAPLIDEATGTMARYIVIYFTQSHYPDTDLTGLLLNAEHDAR